MGSPLNSSHQGIKKGRKTLPKKSIVTTASAGRRYDNGTGSNASIEPSCSQSMDDFIELPNIDVSQKENTAFSLSVNISNTAQSVADERVRKEAERIVSCSRVKKEADISVPTNCGIKEPRISVSTDRGNKNKAIKLDSPVSLHQVSSIHTPASKDRLDIQLPKLSVKGTVKVQSVKKEAVPCSLESSNNSFNLQKDSSLISINSESSFLDNTASSFEFTPKKTVAMKRPAVKNKVVKKRLSVTKRANDSSVKRVAAKGGIVKAKKTLALKKGVAGPRKQKKFPDDDDIEVVFQWDPVNIIAERQGVQEWQARQVINLFDQECTIPFIARYRREKTGDLQIEKLLEVQNAYQQLKEVQQKVTKVIESKPEKMTQEDKQSLLSATSIQEVKVTMIHCIIW